MHFGNVLGFIEANWFSFLGMGASAASRHHQMKLDLTDDAWVTRARADSNPTMRATQYMYSKWLRSTVGGWNDSDMFTALDSFAKNSDNIIEIEVSSDGSFCAALVTPLMARVHGIREASEVVFVDATAAVDRLHTAVIPLLYASPVGALPLGVVFTSSQDEVHLTGGTF